MQIEKTRQNELILCELDHIRDRRVERYNDLHDLLLADQDAGIWHGIVPYGIEEHPTAQMEVARCLLSRLPQQVRAESERDLDPGLYRVSAVQRRGEAHLQERFAGYFIQFGM